MKDISWCRLFGFIGKDFLEERICIFFGKAMQDIKVQTKT